MRALGAEHPEARIRTDAKSRIPTHSFWRWSERALFAAGLILLGYVALIAFQARLYEFRAQQYLDSVALSGLKQPQAPLRERASIESLLLDGAILGRMEIPRLKVSAAVLQGTKARTLRLGVGHINGTALPGEPGNSAIAGHRDTFFRALKNIHPNDEIDISTAAGLSQYQVDWAKVVRPNDLTVLDPSNGSALTLVTCYPFNYFGAAPDRFVVRAHLREFPPPQP